MQTGPATRCTPCAPARVIRTRPGLAVPRGWPQQRAQRRSSGFHPTAAAASEPVRERRGRGGAAATADLPSPQGRKFVYAVDGKLENEAALNWAASNIFSKGASVAGGAAGQGVGQIVLATQHAPRALRAHLLCAAGDTVYLAHCLADPRTPATAVGSSSAATQWSPARDEQR